MVEAHVEIADLGPGEMQEAALFCVYDNGGQKPSGGRFHQGVLEKAAWARARHAEGLRIKLLRVDGVRAGFIEYLPGEIAWRPVAAEGYTFVHCIWVRGRYKGWGYGSRLLEGCLEEAAATKGVATVTSRRGWIADKSFFLHHGFEVVDRVPPFELVAKRFQDVPPPSFLNGWPGRAARYGSGVTVIWSAQCPYLPSRRQDIIEVSEARGLRARAVEVKRCPPLGLAEGEEIGAAVSPFGTFGVLLDGRLITCQPLGRRSFARLLDRALGEGDRAEAD